MQVSVIFTTYNSPKWLQKVLWGFKQQTFKNFEIIIADDGSKNDTRILIDIMRKETCLDIKHVWQEDNGFQKCKILNKAILEAKYDYIVFTDGDCIPRHDFLETHIKNAEPGYFLAGTYIRLPMSTSKSITQADIVSGKCFELKWLTQNGYKNSKNNIKLIAKNYWADFLNRFTTTDAHFSGANSSAWLKDIFTVNGFDERMHYGGEDKEFGIRLKNSGIKAKRVRFSAICIHLDHSRNYVDSELKQKNKVIRNHSKKQKIVSTNYGIKQAAKK